MLKRTTVPDAWEDDDWETQADRVVPEPAAPQPAPAPLTKKERFAQHVEFNRKLWEAAEEPSNGAPLQYISQTPTPPLAQPFKAPMKVLARKPVLAKRDPITGLTNMTMQDDSDDEDKKPQETLDEIRVRQQREREEKQRRYDEVRAKIFGDSAAINSNAKAGSGRSSGTSTPPKPSSERRGRGRGRGGVRGNDRNARHERTESGDYQKQKETAQSIAQSTAQSGGASLRDEGRDKDLYDPNFSPKPTLATGRRSGASTPGRSTPRIDNQVLRAPRGPDGSGRGGFGFTGSDTREV